MSSMENNAQIKNKNILYKCYKKWWKKAKNIHPKRHVLFGIISRFLTVFSIKITLILYIGNLVRDCLKNTEKNQDNSWHG